MIFPIKSPVKHIALQGCFLGQNKGCLKMSFPPLFEVFHRLFPRNKPKTRVKIKVFHRVWKTFINIFSEIFCRGGYYPPVNTECKVGADIIRPLKLGIRNYALCEAQYLCEAISLNVKHLISLEHSENIVLYC